MSAEKYKAITRGGTPWEPEFVTEVDQSTCIGCGRCYKVCPRDVFNLVEREIDEDDDMYDDYEDDVMMVMDVENADDCIGCSACARVCPKDCHTHVAASAL
ncbi:MULTISPECIES: ferredoxin III, nif-specific [Corallincola]|uniref:Ferredoxin III n=3 Tax=Corallincola TaxID=1775176 RepID=A0A368NQU3_9GAMM|nr:MULTISPECIES: ferredoxin III, nif-specific [Corallincola]RCU52516.1 ferredoxin III, nif-specific [Corallincola holothuriorum]TAA48290.1 ferredoxin III, nif-specific [Corallincola spongiicola]TCI02404.1 ferredoxin III, nif-specific [Corallincola luteus]